MMKLQQNWLWLTAGFHWPQATKKDAGDREVCNGEVSFSCFSSMFWQWFYPFDHKPWAKKINSAAKKVSEEEGIQNGTKVWCRDARRFLRVTWLELTLDPWQNSWRALRAHHLMNTTLQRSGHTNITSKNQVPLEATYKDCQEPVNLGMEKENLILTYAKNLESTKTNQKFWKEIAKLDGKPESQLFPTQVQSKKQGPKSIMTSPTTKQRKMTTTSMTRRSGLVWSAGVSVRRQLEFSPATLGLPLPLLSMSVQSFSWIKQIAARWSAIYASKKN